ncbi:MAG: hypothetical protein KA239_11570 [Bacteroidia bacterium]|nr:hypothetical protein [Bacteroidia bacterium]
MKKHILFLAMLCLVQLAAAQASSPNPWAARLDLFHQDYLGEFSFGQLGVYDKVHIRPGLRLGIERSWVTKNHFRLYQDVMLGYYHNTYDERSWTLGTDLGFEWRIFKQFRLALPLGVHYNNAKAIDVRYEYVGDKWVKAKNTDPAINRLQVQTGLNLGWRFLPESAHPVDVFANGNLSVIGPWQPGSGIPALVYKSAGLGLRVGI